jgi:hypothetical protein
MRSISYGRGTSFTPPFYRYCCVVLLNAGSGLSWLVGDAANNRAQRLLRIDALLANSSEDPLPEADNDAPQEETVDQSVSFESEIPTHPQATSVKRGSCSRTTKIPTRLPRWYHPDASPTTNQPMVSVSRQIRWPSHIGPIFDGALAKRSNVVSLVRPAQIARQPHIHGLTHSKVASA